MNNEDIDVIAKKYVGLGGVEDYRSFALDIILAASAVAAGTIELTRYMPVLHPTNGPRMLQRVAAMGEHPTGAYVRHDDHLAAITAASQKAREEARLEEFAHLMQSYEPLMDAASAKSRIETLEQQLAICTADAAKWASLAGANAKLLEVRDAREKRMERFGIGNQRTAGGDAVAALHIAHEALNNYAAFIEACSAEDVDLWRGVQAGQARCALRDVTAALAAQPVLEAAARSVIALDEVELPPNLSHEEARAFILNVAEIVKSQWHAAATPAPVSAEPTDLLQRCLTAMKHAVTYGETRTGRPPQQTCMFEIEELESILSARASLPSAGAPAHEPEKFEAWWAKQINRNGGVEIAADFKHWANRGYIAGNLSAGAPVSGAEQATDDLDTMLTVFDMSLGFALCHRDFASTRNAVKKLQADFADLRAALATAMRQQQGEAYTCIGKGGEYELIGTAKGAGTMGLAGSMAVYRDTMSGALYYREPEDFADRMGKVAAKQAGKDAS